MTRVLAITENVRREINAAVERAAAHPVSLEEVKRVMKGIPQDTPDVKLSDRPADFKRTESEHVLIPHGFRASFSFEHQPNGLCRHLSVSVDTPGRVPNMPAMQVIAEAFGFQSGGPRRFFCEEFEPGHHAVNLVELVTAPTTKVRQ